MIICARSLGCNVSLKLCVLVLAGVVTGCSSGGTDDLRAYVDEVKASRKIAVPPLPEFTPVENFEYAAAKANDPFVSWEVRAARMQKIKKKQSTSSGLQPDLGRRRELLESFPLDTLRMVGTLQSEAENAALIQSPDGLVSRILVGNYLGQNHGKVTSVKSDKVELIEIVPDGLGGWQRRPASVAMPSDDEEASR